MVLARAYAPPCSGSDDTTTNPARAAPFLERTEEERQFMLRSIEPVWVGTKSGAWPRKRAFEWLAGGCLGATCDPVLALEVRR